MTEELEFTGFDEDEELSLLETLDHVLDKGVVLAGDITISVANIDLIFVNLNALLGSVEQGLAKLVLTLIELIRRLLEKQAVRRMEGGRLEDAQVEELGLALMKLEEKMRELKSRFGLEDEDLNLDLGPVGRLI